MKRSSNKRTSNKRASVYQKFQDESPVPQHVPLKHGKRKTRDLLLLSAHAKNTSPILREIEYRHIMSTTRDVSTYILEIRKHVVSTLLKMYNRASTLFMHNSKDYKKLDVSGIDESSLEFLQAALERLNDKAWMGDVELLHKLESNSYYLWNLAPIQCCYELIYNSDSKIEHYMSQIWKIMDLAYSPDYLDVMNMPASPTKICLSLEKTDMHITNVRPTKPRKTKKRAVDLILWMVDLAKFDSNNALKYSIKQFNKVIHDPLFKKTPVLLIFGGYDQFAEKMKNGGSFHSVFQNYHDRPDVKKNIRRSVDYLKKRFEHKLADNDKRLVRHYKTGNYTHMIQEIQKTLKESTFGTVSGKMLENGFM